MQIYIDIQIYIKIPSHPTMEGDTDHYGESKEPYTLHVEGPCAL